MVPSLTPLHFWCYDNCLKVLWHLVPILVPVLASVSCADNTIGVMWCQCQWYHITKRHVASRFDHPDLRNAMMPLMIPSASLDINISTNEITSARMSHCTSFWLSFHKECHDSIDNTVSIIWCQCHLHNITKKVMLHLILISWPNKCIGAIYSAIGIMLFQHQCQWHHMTKNVMLCKVVGCIICFTLVWSILSSYSLYNVQVLLYLKFFFFFVFCM